MTQEERKKRKGGLGENEMIKIRSVVRETGRRSKGTCEEKNESRKSGLREGINMEAEE